MGSEVPAEDDAGQDPGAGQGQAGHGGVQLREPAAEEPQHLRAGGGGRGAAAAQLGAEPGQEPPLAGAQPAGQVRLQQRLQQRLRQPGRRRPQVPPQPPRRRPLQHLRLEVAQRPPQPGAPARSPQPAQHGRQQHHEALGAVPRRGAVAAGAGRHHPAGTRAALGSHRRRRPRPLPPPRYLAAGGSSLSASSSRRPSRVGIASPVGRSSSARPPRGPSAPRTAPASAAASCHSRSGPAAASFPSHGRSGPAAAMARAAPSAAVTGSPGRAGAEGGTGGAGGGSRAQGLRDGQGSGAGAGSGAQSPETRRCDRSLLEPARNRADPSHKAVMPGVGQGGIRGTGKRALLAWGLIFPLGRAKGRGRE